MKKSLIVLTVVSIALSSTLFAQEPRVDGTRTYKCDSKISKHSHHKTHCKKHHKKRGHHRDRGSFKKIFKELDLSYEQKSQIRDIIKKSRRDKRSHRKRDMKRELPDMSSFMTSEKFDKDGFKKAMIEQKAKRDEMREARKAKRLEKKADTM